MKCHQKICYHDGATAEDARQRYIRDHKTDKRNARLVCYICRDCGLWHLGHVRRKKQGATPKPVKQLTPGQQRRTERKAAEKAAHQAQFADYHQTLQFCKMLVDRELARYAALGIKPRTPAPLHVPNGEM